MRVSLDTMVGLFDFNLKVKGSNTKTISQHIGVRLYKYSPIGLCNNESLMH